MEKSGISLVVILVITAIFFSGCTSPASVQSPASSATDPSFNRLLLSSEDLPLGLARAADGAMQPSDITGTMKNFGLIKGYRVLYADAIPLTDKSKVMEQDIMVFPGTNASAMLDEHQKSFTAIQSQNIVALPLPDPNLGDKSFALKISSVGPSGAETHHYVFGFVQSGMYEVISMEETPEIFPALVHIAERAAAKAR